MLYFDFPNVSCFAVLLLKLDIVNLGVFSLRYTLLSFAIFSLYYEICAVRMYDANVHQSGFKLLWRLTLVAIRSFT